jgi:hypothetical protein
MRAAVALAIAPLAFAVTLAGCGGVDADGPDVDASVEADPLAVPDEPAPGSLDELHARIIKPRCSGTPGLCHNGQFEPNLATPGLTYAYLVRRPGLEKPDRLRVDPENAAASLLVDKLRNRNGVGTQMPLGAEPLPEADIAAIEAWIAAGALRAPGMDPAPVLNNPPRKPDIAVYSAAGVRLDDGGAATVHIGQTVTLRHTVADFETADAAIPLAAMLLFAGDGLRVVLEPASDDPSVGLTAYDAAGPMGAGDVFDFRRAWSVTAMIEVVDDAGVRSSVPANGLTITPIAIYYDSIGADGIAAFAFGERTIRLVNP